MNDLELRMAKKAGMLDALYAQRVSELIRAKYTLNDELSILRQRDTKPEEYEAYNRFAEECKTKAKQEIK